MEIRPAWIRPPILAACAAILLTGCASRAVVLGLAPTALPAPSAAGEARSIGLRLAEADALAARGTYTTLKRAAAIYREIESGPPRLDPSAWLDRAAESLLRTTLLITVREKDLGILSLAGIDEARRIAAAGVDRGASRRPSGRSGSEAAGGTDSGARPKRPSPATPEISANRPDFEAYAPYIDIAGYFWAQGEGITRNADERFQPEEIVPRLADFEPRLAAEASRDDFRAYMYATLLRINPDYPGRGPKRLEAELEALVPSHPDSFLVRDLLARLPEPKSASLAILAAAEPEYFEAGYYLGEMAMRAGLLLMAEKHLLPAHDAIPESPRIPMLLGAAAFALEEFDRGLTFYEKTVALAPESRDALLGKAVCLSFLARHEEALQTLRTMIDLGHVMLGEAHYWTAWNLRELERRPEAEAHVGEAKSRLPTDTQVFWLAGMLALDRGDLDTAEKEFLESLRFSPENVESLYQLGIVFAKKRNWLLSARSYHFAAAIYGESVKELAGKITELQAADLAEGRKARLIKRREAQRRTAELLEATSFFNAAAGYHNCGQNSLARPDAERAKAHPALKSMAEELLALLK